MNRLITSLSLLVLAGTLSGCGSRDSKAVGSIDLSSVSFHVFRKDMGVHPSKSVLDDPNNVFADVPIDALNNGTPEDPADKWKLDPTAPTPASFYLWATTLTGAPNGENQYYTASKLQKIYEEQLVAPDQLEAVQAMAVAAFSAQLQYFPEDVNRDAQGNPQWDYATASLKGIRALNGTPPPGWLLVTDADGQERAAKY